MGLQHDGFDAFQMEKMGEKQPRRSRAGNADLRASMHEPSIRGASKARQNRKQVFAPSRLCERPISRPPQRTQWIAHHDVLPAQPRDGQIIALGPDSALDNTPAATGPGAASSPMAHKRGRRRRWRLPKYNPQSTSAGYRGTTIRAIASC